MNISSEELSRMKDSTVCKPGYRLVYYYNDTYDIGAYCETIEGFMIGLVDCDPIDDEDDIPPFISLDDMLDRCLKLSTDATAVALYTTTGKCIARKDRQS